MSTRSERSRFLALAAAGGLVLATLAGLGAPAEAASTPAFPGASGPAMYATGGRGGDVYHVTNLTDNAGSPAAGSLRYGIVNTPSSGRTIVFDVAGTIRLSPAGRQGWLSFGASNLTIAGQTAPKPGITIMGQATKITGKNVIVRNVKFRPGKDQANPETATNDGIWITGDQVIVDHNSVSWADDEGISVSDGAGQVTVQYNIVSEPLNYKGHGYGALVGSDVNGSNIAYHHNLFAHAISRLPRLGNETGAVNSVEWSNNIIFEGKGYSGDNQPVNANFVGNTYLRHNSSSPAVYTGSSGTNAYLSGNRVDYDGDSNLTNGTDAGWSVYTGVTGQKSSRYAVPNMTTESASAAVTNVLSRSGAFFWSRDSTDARIVSETRSTSGTFVNEAPSSEWNSLWNASSVSRASNWDTDKDGMPDAWESANGFNPGSDDHNGDADGDGYRNLEEYLDYAANGGVTTGGGTTTTTTSRTTTTSATTSTTSRTTTTTTGGGTTGTCSASYTAVGSWDGGWQGEVKVTAGSSAISGWTVKWTLASGQTISQAWNGKLTTSGSSVSVANETYNGALAAGASTTFGFIGTGTASTPSLTCS